MAFVPRDICGFQLRYRRGFHEQFPFDLNRLFHRQAEVALQVAPHRVDVVGVVLSVVVFDDERLPLDSVVVALVEVWVAVPSEGDVVQTGRVDGGSAFLFDVSGEVLEVLGHQVLEQFLLIGRHLSVGQADGSRFDGRLRSAGAGDFIGGDLAHPAELLLIGRAELEYLTRDVFLRTEDSNLSVLARFNRAGIGPEEFGSARHDLAILDAEVERQVMALDTPAPQAGVGRLTEDTQVVLVRTPDTIKP